MWLFLWMVLLTFWYPLWKVGHLNLLLIFRRQPHFLLNEVFLDQYKWGRGRECRMSADECRLCRWVLSYAFQLEQPIRNSTIPWIRVRQFTGMIWSFTEFQNEGCCSSHCKMPLPFVHNPLRSLGFVQWPQYVCVTARIYFRLHSPIKSHVYLTFWPAATAFSSELFFDLVMFFRILPSLTQS